MKCRLVLEVFVVPGPGFHGGKVNKNDNDLLFCCPSSPKS